MQESVWKIWIDTGGTFTDCLALSPKLERKHLKILSSGLLRLKITRRPSANAFTLQFPFSFLNDFLSGFQLTSEGKTSKIINVDAGSSTVWTARNFENLHSAYVEITSHEEVPVFATRILTETGLKEPFPSIDLKLGSTKGTNALLERKGSRTALILTKGFKDLLLIGNQQRPELFALRVVKTLPLYHTVYEIDERIDSAGEIEKILSVGEINRVCEKLKEKKIQTVAIALINSYRNPKHEMQLAARLKKSGIRFVSCSNDQSDQIKILPRAQTAVVNAYLSPLIEGYIDKIKEGLQTSRFRIMSSAGSLLHASRFKPKDSLLSGPAGGVIGALRKARLSGIDRIVTFDMGGTSTDVSLCDGNPEYYFECSVGDQKILSPSIAIETIAAGGGSICVYDGDRFTVGPHSAGASPGPACYGKGGPLTLTDMNLFLGRLDAETFSIPINLEHAEKKIEILLHEYKKGKPAKIRSEDILEACLDIANERMAEAIRKVSIQRGFDVRNYALLCFGGAGGQHACALSSMLGIHEIIAPLEAGLLSAYGIGHADIERIKEKLLLAPLQEVAPILDSIIAKLFELGRSELIGEGYNRQSINIRMSLLFLRLKGQETSLEIAYEKGANIETRFKEKYIRVYGHWLQDSEVEIESIRVIVSVHQQADSASSSHFRYYKPRAVRRKRIFSAGFWIDCPVYVWENLKPGARFDGPSLVISNNSTFFVEQGWRFMQDRHDNARIRKRREAAKHDVRAKEAKLELYTNRFAAIAQDMGALLQRTSFSVNIKERLDFSCALLDGSGRLVVNAPHIPVHLGGLGVCVRAVIKALDMKPGDVIITNHPAYGGSHLPDITLIKPIFRGRELIGFVANRAHHAEIGGKRPGSMPADATRLNEEGVVIAPRYLIRSGQAQWSPIRTLLLSPPFPTRNVQENMADLNGALASLMLGEKALQSLCDKFGKKEVVGYMKKLYAYSGEILKRKITHLANKTLRAREYLDDGSLLRISVSTKNNKLIIDFSGSSGVHPGNFNATKGIVHSVVLYTMRLLIDAPLPLNEGLLRAVKMIIPPGMLNPKFYKMDSASPAVVGGNTEVSQRLTDTLLKSFRLAACSQGTMNNFLFGTDAFGYYETICGGTGAGPDFHGADAVHQHMTNTRITDPEIIEHRYPVSIRQFGIRRGSGGKGKWRGGNGAIREFLFRECMEINILSQHRKVKPYGRNGGGPGATGLQYILRANGKMKLLSGVSSAILFPGDRVIIKTPGGGGWGKP
jgi:5-oxoprolinase (ATP-hydrolysing)